MAGSYTPSTAENGKSTSTALPVDKQNAQPDHQFKPLQDPKQTFRVLRLLSEKGDDSIRATLHEKWLDQPTQSHASKHLALSYEWGDAKNRQNIEVDGQQYQVRRNLYDYLTTARDNEWLKDTEVFIDAICIDQENLTERSDQVKQMRHIYSRATHVAAWLGPSRDGSDKLFKMFNIDPGDLGSQSLLRHALDEHYSDDLGPYRFNHAARSFLARTYWQRLWVVPEILLSKEVTLCCGHSSAPLNASVANMMFDIRKIREMKPLHFEGAGSHYGPYFQEVGLFLLDWIDRKRAKKGRSFSSSYHHLISTYGSRLCADPRDHVYAVLSIGVGSKRASRRRDREKLSLESANYSKSSLWLFFQVMASVWPERLLHFGIDLRRVLKLTAPIHRQPLPPSVITAADMPLEEFDDQVFQMQLLDPFPMEGSFLEYWSLTSTRYPILRCYKVQGAGRLVSMRLCTTADSRDGDYYFSIDQDCLHAGLIFRAREASRPRRGLPGDRSSTYILVGFGTEIRNDAFLEDADVVPSDTELEEAMKRLEALDSCPLLKRVGSEFKFPDIPNCTINIDWLDMLQLTTPCDESKTNGDFGEYGCMACTQDTLSIS